MTLPNEAAGPADVIVACPKTQHSYQTALALQEQGLLCRYITGFYHKRSGAVTASLRLLQPGMRQRVERELRRRRLDALNDELIETVPLGDVVCSALERSPRFRAVSRRFRLWDWHLARFQQHVARRVRELRPRAVVCYDGSARVIFEAARSVGAVCILDQTIGHVTSCIEELGAIGIDLQLPRSFVSEAQEEVKEADLIVAGSDYVRDTLLKVGVPRDRVAVIPYGVDLSRFMPHERGIDNQHIQALYVGQIAARKGVQFLVEAFDRIADPRLHLRLVGTLLGDPAWVQGHGTRFEYQRSVPQHEVARVYNEADFFVQLSLHEGSSLTTYEALAAGLPVITTPNSGSVVRDGVEGFIVPPRDVDAVVERMTRLTTDASLRREMAVRARRRAESFSWSKYRERFADLLKSPGASVTGSASQQEPAPIAG